MADGITPTQRDRDEAEAGIEMQLKAALMGAGRCRTEDDYAMVRDELSALGLDDFIDNQIECAAYDRATIRELYRIINKPLNNG